MKVWRGRGIAASAKGAAAAVFFVAALLLLVFIFASVQIDGNTIDLKKSWKLVRGQRSDLPRPPSSVPPTIPITLTCPTTNPSEAPTCPNRSMATSFQITPTESTSAPPTCPDYFRWIHEDLRPWKATGITREAVETARKHATFRLVVRGGRAYLDTYGECYQTRANFTLWGILQLLSRYPGRVPDVDLMFQCNDTPVVKAADYREKPGAAPPPLFRYCKDDETLDIPFPDWSFWGWAEVNIRPWGSLVEEMKRMNKKVKWKDRRPYAYWKGNPSTSDRRADLLNCNASDHKHSGVLIYAQNWEKEVAQGFPTSNISKQCLDRYKIFIEGRSWSVSDKYILGCNSPALFVTTHFYDIYTRSLEPGYHYWPIDENHMCKSINFAVLWGNSNQNKAQAIGNAGSKFAHEQLKMDYIYDYMLHLLIEYSKLLRFKPVIPDDSEELCLESLACAAGGTARKFMLESMVSRPSQYPPCAMPPPYTTKELRELRERKDQELKKLERMEQKNSQK